MASDLETPDPEETCENGMQIEYLRGRWYGVTSDTFDGTAQGYGFKTKQNLMRARWYYLNRSRLASEADAAQKWLDVHSEARTELDAFLDADNWLRALKEDGEGLSLPRFLEEHRATYAGSPWFQELEADAALARKVWRFLINGLTKNRGRKAQKTGRRRNFDAGRDT